MKLDSQKKFYIGIAVVLVALIIIYPYISETAQYIKIKNKIPIIPTYCGDGICNGVETHATCPGDCVYDCTYDSDGMDQFTKGYITINTYTYWDTCVDSNTVREFHCVASPWSTEIDCPTTCSNGVCSQPTPTKVNPVYLSPGWNYDIMTPFNYAITKNDVPLCVDVIVGFSSSSAWALDPLAAYDVHTLYDCIWQGNYVS